MKYHKSKEYDAHQVSSLEELKTIVLEAEGTNTIRFYYTNNLLFVEWRKIIEGKYWQKNRILITKKDYWNVYMTGTAKEEIKKLGLSVQQGNLYICDRKKETLIAKEINTKDISVNFKVDCPFELTEKQLKRIKWEQFKSNNLEIICIFT